MRSVPSVFVVLGAATALVFSAVPSASPQSAAAEEMAVQIGDSEDSARERLGKPMGTYRRGSRTVLLYASGEVSVENGKVVDVLRRAASSAATPKPAAPPPKPPEPPPPKSPPSPATHVVPVKAAPPAPAKPEAGQYPTDPNTRETLVREIPAFGELERDIASAVARNGITVTQKEILEQIDSMWRACFSGGGTAVARLRWEMGQFDNRSVASMPFDPKDERENANTFKFRRGGDWEYANAAPDSTTTVECWKKRVADRGTEQRGSIVTAGGTRTDWGRMTWEASLKKWVWTIPSQRQVFLSEYEGKLRQETADWKTKAANPATAGGASRDIAVLVRSFEPHFRYRYLERFVGDFRAVPWPE